MTTESDTPRLFSYVVEHDNGFAPCVEQGLCSLAVCKFSHSGRPNVVELARVGDWVVGTGGASRKSAGHGRIVYAMRVTQKMSLAEFVSNRRYRRRRDSILALANPIAPSRLALLSTEFWYFGDHAPSIEGQQWGRGGQFEKRGPGFRNRFEPEVIAAFERWIRRNWSSGVHGAPCEHGEGDGASVTVATRPSSRSNARRRQDGCGPNGESD